MSAHRQIHVQRRSLIRTSALQKLLHTMAARFPEEPTENERETFKSFLFLFSRLYPCGEVRPRLRTRLFF